MSKYNYKYLYFEKDRKKYNYKFLYWEKIRIKYNYKYLYSEKEWQSIIIKIYTYGEKADLWKNIWLKI